MLRKAGREDLPDPVEDALRRTVATGVTRRAALHRRGRRRPAHGGRRPRARAVRPRAPRAGGDPAAACPAAGTSGSGTPTPTPPSPRRRSPPTWRTASPRCGWCSGDGAIAGRRARRRALRRPARPRAGDRRSGGPAGPPRRSSPWSRAARTSPPAARWAWTRSALQAATGEAQDLSGLADVARRAAAHAGLRTVVVDATVFADAGASAVEELGCSLAAGTAYLRALTEGGPDASTRRSRSWSSATPRAPTSSRRSPRCAPPAGCGTGSARSAAPSPEVRGQRQHAVTSSVMTTKRDPWVNMLRTTVACFAAGVGGADVVTVQPFDAALGPARRLLPPDRAQHPEPAGRGGAPGPGARPGRRLLVRRVADRRARPGGVGLVHRDRAGRRPGRRAGLRAGRATGSPRPGTSAPTRLAHRADAITGVSEFPNLAEKLPEREPAADRPPPTGGLPRVRAAQEFEELRDAADAAATARRGLPRHARADRPAHRPGDASPATCSRPAASRRRPATAPRASPRRGRRSPASAAPTRTTRPTAAGLATELREAGATQVWLAGKPDLDVDGVDGYVFAGCDALDVLRDRARASWE